MKIIDTSKPSSDANELSDDEVYWVYNGLDCGVTFEIRNRLNELLDPVRRATYQRTMDLHAPFLDMMLRGVLVDPVHVNRVLGESRDLLADLEKKFARLCIEGLGLPTAVNWRSPLQLKNLFYGILGLPEIKKANTKGIKVPVVDRETLERLTQHFFAEPFCNFILLMRDYGKMIGFLETPQDADGRLRCNFNLAGTDTGRQSSSFSDFGTGTNLQNIDRNLRYIFVPDPGKVFINVDLEQADSRNVGALCWNMFYDAPREEITKLLRKAGRLADDKHWEGPIGPEFAGSYLDACESGDLHTYVCRMAWTDLDWPDDRKAQRIIADGNAYRTYSYRDMAKKLGHGTNYLGQPKTMAGHTKVPVKMIGSFQNNYFNTFPCIPAWHSKTIQLLQSTGSLTHLFGRQRIFFDRLDAQSTINAAIAYCPQGMTADEINTGIQTIWRDPRLELLVQVHDSILMQCDQRLVNEMVPYVLENLPAKLILKGGREFSVPVEAKVGWNWGDKNESNPLGLAKWKGEETRVPPRRLVPLKKSIRSLL